MSTTPVRKKLIEVALPLQKINEESAREKSIRQGHPSTLHLWWARRPLAAARAVLWSQFVDDPSSWPEEFPTPEAQAAERRRLHEILERLVVWENTRDQALLNEAHAEIVRSMRRRRDEKRRNGEPVDLDEPLLPPVLDPFAGGGSIPLEAQRLGFEAHASDLNPVAVLINKALIEIPPTFRDRPPTFPGLAQTRASWPGATGLAADVKAYGEWMRDQALERIGHHYPPATLADGSTAPVIAWIWARTVTCPNPACGIEMPLVRSWWLGKKKGKEAYVVPRVVPDPHHPSGKRVTFTIGHDPSTAPTSENDGTVSRTGAICVACDTAVPLTCIRDQGKRHRIGATLMALVGAGQRQRIYLPPTTDHVIAAHLPRPEGVPEGPLPFNPRDFKTPNYGMDTWDSLFTNRQLVALTTFSDLVGEAREKALQDALAAGLAEGERLERGGTEAAAYADAIATYLALGLSRMTDISNSLCRWENTKEQTRNLFSRQAIPMVWDYSEPPPFGKAAGSYTVSLASLIKCIVDTGGSKGHISQADAGQQPLGGFIISTDPPYYDNIGYSDLSDFFYVWLRRCLRGVHSHLFSTVLVPKDQELVANPYRHGGKTAAKQFFEDGFKRVFERARETQQLDVPITVYYAFKQSDNDGDEMVSSGWETLLEGMIHSNWAITATWPLRSELSNRILSQGTNALASSIVLAMRPRPATAVSIDRRGFIAQLEAELPQALRDLQHGAIAPVDLPQAAIGPGMAVFSRYAKVMEADGSPMSVRSALARINEILDQVLSEQEGDFDPTTRFAIVWYRQHAYGAGTFGDADNIARARNTSIDTLARDGILHSAAGKVALHSPAALPTGYDVLADDHTSAWEALHHLMRILDGHGVAAAGAFLARAESRPDGAADADLVKQLAFLLHSIADKNAWSRDAQAFNAVATAWNDILAASREPIPDVEVSTATDILTASRRQAQVAGDLASAVGPATPREVSA